MPASQTHLQPLRMYFGYGSNLWRQQMKLRCSSSTYLGVGRLSGYRWIINDRGYANVVSSTNKKDVVYGLIYGLTPSDERSLDLNEGVPDAYTKETLVVDYWAPKDGNSVIDVKKNGEKHDMLVYIDRKRTKVDRPKSEYILRMNWGIDDGLQAGIPKDYVDRVLREFIPEATSKDIEGFARKQAAAFKDES